MDEINRRILWIIEEEGLSQVAFADSLEVNKATLNHIINGRNNPSVPILQKIAQVYPKYSLRWLLTGKGSKYEKINEASTTADANSVEVISYFEDKIDEMSKELNRVKETTQLISDNLIQEENKKNSISRIIVYFSDNSFEVFTPE